MSSVKPSTSNFVALRRTLIIIGIFGICEGAIWSPDKGEDQCASAIKETIFEDRATIVDESGSRLQSTWLSQECEVRAGPEYVIRKYTFFENGTFLLLRHHYAEESCSVAMYTVAARGAIRLLTGSTLAPGATDARYQLDRVHIVPLTRQVAQKFSHRVNVSCMQQPRWRPYVPQLIYEQPSRRYSNFLWEGPKYNTLQRHNPTAKKHRGLDCLEPLGIEFGELRLVRVQKRSSTSTAFALGSNRTPRVELLLGSLPPNVYSKKTHRSTSLQPTPLLRADTTRGCLVCGAISRGTESSPPLLHEVAALPALLGGKWLSSGCESSEGGNWMKRQMEVYSGDMLWTGRWDYYGDARCTMFLYAVTAAGSYIQRAGRQRRHGETDRDLEKLLAAPEEPSVDNSSEEGAVKQDVRQAEYFFRTRRSLADGNLKREEETEEKETDNLEDINWLRTKKELAEWMTPELARNLFEIYGRKKEITEAMLPTIEEIREAIGTSTEATVETLMKVDVLSTVDDPSPSESEDTTSNSNFLSHFSSSYSPSKATESTGEEAERLLSEGTLRKRPRRGLDGDDSYRHLLQNAQPSMADAFAAMLRGNQRREETTKKPLVSHVPTGTTELDLHVAESLLIAGDLAIAARCGAQILGDEREVGSRGLRIRPLSVWPRSCVQHALEAPSTLGLRARVGVNWSGQYTLLLGPRDDHLWEAPLQQCGPAASHNPALRAHLRRSVGLRYGLYTSAAGFSAYGDSHSAIVLQSLFLAFVFSLWR